MLSREVDALRDALESQLGSETEILSINDELRRRCEGAEQATERAERECERAARTHSDAMARVVNELREARELAESLAKAANAQFKDLEGDFVLGSGQAGLTVYSTPERRTPLAEREQ